MLVQTVCVKRSKIENYLIGHILHVRSILAYYCGNIVIMYLGMVATRSV